MQYSHIFLYKVIFLKNCTKNDLFLKFHIKRYKLIGLHVFGCYSLDSEVTDDFYFPLFAYVNMFVFLKRI